MRSHRRSLRLFACALPFVWVACASQPSVENTLPGESGAVPINSVDPNSTAAHGYEGPAAAGNPASPNGYGPFAVSLDANWPATPASEVNLGEGATCVLGAVALAQPLRVALEANSILSARGQAVAHTFETANFAFRWGSLTSVSINGNAVDVQTLVTQTAPLYETLLQNDCARLGAGYCGTAIAHPHKLNIYLAGTSRATNDDVPENWSYSGGLSLLPGENPNLPAIPARQDPFVSLLPADLTTSWGPRQASQGVAYMAAFASPLASTSAAVGIDSYYALSTMLAFYSDITTDAVDVPYYQQLRAAAALSTVHPNFDRNNNNYATLMGTWAATFCTNGLQQISQAWSAAQAGDDFTAALARVARGPIPAFDLGNFYADYAARHALYDFHDAALRRAAIVPLRANHWATYESIYAVADGPAGAYSIAAWAAPQPWGHNIIRLVPALGAKNLVVTLTPAGTNVASGAVRGKLAILGADGTTRYSDPFIGRGSIALHPGNDVEVYLTVTATPTPYVVYPAQTALHAVPTTAYNFTVSGAVPLGQEPYQPTYCDSNDATTGQAHPNGGGFVSNTAHVDPNAYIGPQAQVCGSAQVLGNARILDRAYVGGGGTVQDNAVVENFATVTFGLVRDTARVQDQAHVQDGTVAGSAIINHMALISSGTATLDGTAMLTDYASMEYTSHVSGNAVVGGHVSVNQTNATCSAGTHVDGQVLDIDATPCQ